MEKRDFPYEIDGKKFTGYLADGSGGRKTAGVLVCYEASGMNDHTKERAHMLAEQGYVALATDVFGEVPQKPERMMELVGLMLGDLPVLRKRITFALDLLKRQPNVDPARTAGIGFCFGGSTVLELARSGADVKAVVGFHSGLQTTAPAKNVKSKVLVCIGVDDPIIPPEQRDAFVKEMCDAKVDWQMLLQGGVGHSFTNKSIDAMNMPGFKYDEAADKRSWAAMRELFDRVLGPVKPA
jgi:dienelactone hydrolase